MTDREPDDLYDALRDRLADYGQEPPAPLWAGIRAQLPPPVAQPKLRRRRRMGLLALLLLIVSVGSWQWWQMAHKDSSFGTGTTAATAPASTNKVAGLHQTNSAEKRQNIANSPDYASAHATEASTQPNSASASTAAASGIAGTSGAASASKTSASSTSATAAVASPKRAPANLAMGRTANASGAGTGRQSNSSAALSKQAGVLAAGPDAAKSRSLATTRNQDQTTTRRKSAQAAIRSSTPPAEQHGQAASLATNKPKRHSFGSKRTRANAAETTAAAGNMPATAFAGSIAASTDEADSARAKRLQRAVHVATANPGQGRTTRPAKGLDASVAVVPQAFSADGPTAAAPVSFVAWSLLQPRTVALALQPWATPALQLNSDTLPHLPGSVVRRWAVQVLAGPALTYRQLSTSSAAYSPAPIATPNPTANYAAATSSIAGLERAALGGGAQVMVQRTLTKNWTLSAGLGYTQYATRLAVQQVSLNTTTTFRPDSGAVTTSIHRRDIYHFATVPLRVGYGWTLTGRWRVGLQAGADAAFYMGGNSTEGSACACQTQNWGITGSPYRPFSLGVSLGAEVYYRLTDRWALVARPTASYLLTPLARSSAAYGERHLLGGTALLGVSYDLP